MLGIKVCQKFLPCWAENRVLEVPASCSWWDAELDFVPSFLGRVHIEVQLHQPHRIRSGVNFTVAWRRRRGLLFVRPGTGKVR